MIHFSAIGQDTPCSQDASLSRKNTLFTIVVQGDYFLNALLEPH